jgi:hypothetical protein
MATIFAVIFYVVIVLIIAIGGYATYVEDYNLTHIAYYYLILIINNLLSFLLISSVINVVLFLVEGFLLILDSTIKFEDRFNQFEENKK